MIELKIQISWRRFRIRLRQISEEPQENGIIRVRKSTRIEFHPDKFK